MSNINFEDDQTKMLGKTENIQSLADQVERLDQLLKQIELDEDLLKQKKKIMTTVLLKMKSHLLFM